MGTQQVNGFNGGSRVLVALVALTTGSESQFELCNFQEWKKRDFIVKKKNPFMPIFGLNNS